MFGGTEEIHVNLSE